MFKLAYALEALPGGARDRFVTFRFRIENLGDAPVRLVRVTPIPSDDVTVSASTTTKQDSPATAAGRPAGIVGANRFVVSDAAAPGEAPLPAYRQIAPEETFETRFDVSFTRKWINPYHCTFAVDAVVDDGPPGDGGPDSDRLIHATTSHLVAPLPTLLSGVAVLGAVAGVVIRTALAYDGDTGVIGAAVAPLVAATLIALVVFNAYEYVDVTKGAEAPPSWRSAFFIGALCGLFSHQIMAALEAFVAPAGG